MEKKDFDKDNVRIKAASLMDQIDRVEALIGDGKYEEAERYADKLKAKIRKMRKTGQDTSRTNRRRRGRAPSWSPRAKADAAPWRIAAAMRRGWLRGNVFPCGSCRPIDGRKV